LISTAVAIWVVIEVDYNPHQGFGMSDLVSAMLGVGFEYLRLSILFLKGLMLYISFDRFEMIPKD
jgi:hypothetical protein